MLQTDSISNAYTEAGEGEVVVKYHPPTPAQIVSWLPKTATEAQKDSAIQKYLRPREIRWSTRPDTLHLPGQPVGRSVLDVSLPQYYKESFFSDKDYFHPEIIGGRQGVAGDPMPYTIAGDNMMSLLLLVCFVATMISISRSRTFIARQVKSFFLVQRGNTTEVTETSAEVRFQLLLLAETCILLAVLFLSYLMEAETTTYTVSQFRFIEILTGVFAGYYLAKYILYQLVNWVFFNEKNIQQWNVAYLFMQAMQGVLLLPLVFVQSFFNLSIGYAAIYFIIVAILFKFLEFYKQQQIFFPQNGRFLQNILYFCMLELVPVFIIWNILGIISEYLEINF